ncbi:hypothetical protein AB9P05_00450 [Roseivirga sp. BDSF3-8]|uniref:hypothetical protein n=1 Tax=Roseivirga sp. BDSF3-8 TaxID=3241598 RepID=UPI003531D7BF
MAALCIAASPGTLREVKILRKCTAKVLLLAAPVCILIFLYLCIHQQWSTLLIATATMLMALAFTSTGLGIYVTTKVVQSTYTINEAGITRHAFSDLYLSWPGIKIKSLKNGDLSLSKPKIYPLHKPMYRKNEIIIYQELRDFDQALALIRQFSGGGR